LWNVEEDLAATASNASSKPSLRAFQTPTVLVHAGRRGSSAPSA